MESHCDQLAACDAAGMKRCDATALGETSRRDESRAFVAICCGMARDGAGGVRCHHLMSERRGM